MTAPWEYPSGTFPSANRNPEHAMQNPVVWFEIYVEDMPRARAFYERVLGQGLSELPNSDPAEPCEMWALPMDTMAPGAAGVLAKMPGMDPGAGGTLVYFGCADCGAAADRAVSAGGQLVRDKQAIGPFGFIALVRDTEGNTIGLHSMQ